MANTNIEMYKASIMPIKKMLLDGLITESQYAQAELFLAQKYCINYVSIYRSNDLTSTPIKWIYSNTQKEVICYANSKKD